MHTRINEIVKKSGLTKTDFAKRIGLSQSHVSRICSGETTPSDRTISDICRAFNVNRRYLEQGEEPMFLPELDPDTDFVNALLENNDSPMVDVIRAIMQGYVKLPADGKKKVDDFISSIVDNLKDKDRD